MTSVQMGLAAKLRACYSVLAILTNLKQKMLRQTVKMNWNAVRITSETGNAFSKTTTNDFKNVNYETKLFRLNYTY